MMESLLVLLLGAWIFYKEGLSLRKKKQKRAFWVFTALLFFSIAVYLSVVHDVPLPNPTDVIATILEPIYKPIAIWVKGGTDS